jgi:hypothetical protein
MAAGGAAKVIQSGHWEELVALSATPLPTGSIGSRAKLTREVAVVIRPATVADASAIGALKVRAWRADYAAFLPADLLATLDPAAEAGDWADYLATMPGSALAVGRR